LTPSGPAKAEEELRAARKTIEALVRRAEQAEIPAGEGVFALQKAIASLETIIQQRTRALHASEARYRALFDHSPDMIVTVDEDHRITAANQTSLSALDIEEKNLLGGDFSRLFDAASAARARRIVEEQGVGDVTPELRLRDGRVVSVTASPLPGYAGALQVVLRDVTSRRELETELHHARRLAAIGNLAAGVAHEINNPLAVIQLRLDLLERLHAEYLEPLQDQLQVIDRHVHRIARIVQNLQTFARPQATELDLCPVAELIAAASGVAEISLSHVDLEVDVVDDLVLQVDRGQIEQVLANLFTNAGQAMKAGGRITVKARPVGERVHITIRDTGPGIPEGLVESIFTPFVTTKGPSEGSGLGLAIAWSIVQEHGGTIRASNLAGGGAEFVLELPGGRIPATSAPDTPPHSPRRPSRILRVLCVDDEPGMLQAVCNLVEEAGHVAVGVLDGRAALDAVACTQFDVLLTDIRMPDMGGLELAAAIRAHDPLLADRTILMSGLFHNPEPGRRYLQKPFGREQLLQALEETVGEE
jgi:PAS domain S-box-containing protein